MTDEEKQKEKERQAEMEKLVCDALLERPISFKTNDGRFYYIYPPSLGIQLLCDPIVRNLDIDPEFLKLNSTMEMLRVVRSNREELLRLVAYHSFKRRSDASVEDMVQKRIEEFRGVIDDSDLLTLFSYIKSWDTWPSKIMEFYKIDKDREEKEEVHRELSKKGGLVFGGLSIFGRLIDFSCQRYGWQVGYVIWGVSSTNLSLMMADSISTVQLTKDEISKMGISNDRDAISADDPANWQKIRELVN